MSEQLASHGSEKHDVPGRVKDELKAMTPENWEKIRKELLQGTTR